MEEERSILDNQLRLPASLEWPMSVDVSLYCYESLYYSSCYGPFIICKLTWLNESPSVCQPGKKDVTKLRSQHTNINDHKSILLHRHVFITKSITIGNFQHLVSLRNELPNLHQDIQYGQKIPCTDVYGI